MVKTYLPSDCSEVVCPSCGAGIKAPPSRRSRRVQCPKCREIVVIEKLAEPPAEKEERLPAAQDPAKEHTDTAALATRVATLEAAVAALIAVSAVPEQIFERKKVLWATASAADPLQAFTPEREQALAHNLGTWRTREIIIRAAAGDSVALERAVCFKEIFERAGWTVQGPENIAPEDAGTCLALGVPELPVGKEAAQTYLALKAAGFEPVPVLDSTLPGSKGNTVLSLTLPPEKHA